MATLTLPRLQQSSPLVDNNGYPTSSFHIWWDNFASAIETAYNNQQSQIDAITALNSDNILTPAKKPMWILFNAYLTGEQSSIDAEASTYGITTEKTNYDNAISTLTSYLATLTTPVAWNDLSDNTNVTGTTLRTNFQNVLTTKQILLNKMHDKSLSTANTAQSTANTAQSTATTAQSTATTAQTTANTANTNATAAQTTANTAQSTANTVTKNDAISVSYVAPGQILTATDAGSDVTLTIDNHNRHYGDQSSVAVTGATITGLAYSTTYYVYYDDSSRAGGSVTYHTDTNPNNALPAAASGRHYVGRVATPAAGGTATTGGSSPPSAGGGIPRTEVPLS